MDPARPLPPALTGHLLHLGQGGPVLRGYLAGSGPPSLLVHSINAAAAAAELAARTGNGPVDALTASLSCEFLARAALTPAGRGKRGKNTKEGAQPSATGSHVAMSSAHPRASAAEWRRGRSRSIEDRP